MSFSFSDLIIFTTLIINAGAVLNFKLPSNPSLDGDDSAKARLLALVSSLRVFRVFIAAWNVFVLVRQRKHCALRGAPYPPCPGAIVPQVLMFIWFT